MNDEYPDGPHGTAHIVRIKIGRQWTCTNCGTAQVCRSGDVDVCVECGHTEVGGERSVPLDAPDYGGHK